MCIRDRANPEFFKESRRFESSGGSLSARENGMSTGTIYIWRSKYGGLVVNEAKQLKELKEANRRPYGWRGARVTGVLGQRSHRESDARYADSAMCNTLLGLAPHGNVDGGQ